MTQADFVALLRAMGATTPKLIEQAPDGLLMLGALGEQLSDRFEFYAVFASDEEYRIVTEHRALGMLPIFNPLRAGDYLTFAGRRWIVEAVDDKAKVVRVGAAPVGRLPKFQAQEGAPLDDKLVEAMHAVYRAVDRPVYLDATGWELLQEGRSVYAELDLARHAVIQDGDDAFVFLWRGTRATETFRLALAHSGVQSISDTLGVRAPKCDAGKLSGALAQLKANPPTASQLAAKVETLRRQKYDNLLPDELLRDAFARLRLDMPALNQILKTL